jgi:hypothetical protein
MAQAVKRMKRRLVIAGLSALLLGGAALAYLRSRPCASHGVSVLFLGYTNLPSGRDAIFELKNGNARNHGCSLLWIQRSLRPADGSTPTETKFPPFEPRIQLEPGETIRLTIREPKTSGSWRCTFYVMHSLQQPEWKYKVARILDRVGLYRHAIDVLLFNNVWPVHAPEIGT